MAFALFGERLAPLAIVGMAVCVAGVFLVNWRPARSRGWQSRKEP
jgi:drug/metabolite transporter (DMT)-like permease